MLNAINITLNTVITVEIKVILLINEVNLYMSEKTEEFLMVDIANNAANALAEQGINARVINIHTIKPLDKDIILKAAKETGAIVVAEEHNVIGGLGSAVTETVCESFPVPVLRVGTNDVFGRSGKVPPLLQMYGLTAENIAENGS